MEILTKILFLLLVLTQICFTQWEQTPLDSLTVNCFAISGTNIFAGTGWWGIGGGVFLSNNNGTSWSAVNEGLPKAGGDTAQYTVVRCCVSSGMNLFVGTDGSGIFLSTNNGTSWSAVNSGLTDSNVYTLAVSSTNLFAGTNGGVFLSTDNGTSWTAVNAGLMNTYVVALVVSGTNLFAGTSGGGVFLSTNNGTSWTAVNTGLTSTNVLSLTVSGTNLFAGTMTKGVFLSSDSGANWKQVIAGLPWNSNAKALVAYGTNLFTSISNSGGIFLSTNNGTSWTAVNSGLTNYFVNVLAVSSANLFAGAWEYGMGDGGVWRRPLAEMVTDVSEELLAPSQFRLFQNYPNPFNPTTTIGFGISEKGNVRLSILNILGEEIKILLNEEKEAGYHSVDFNASNLPSGVYFYRINSGNFIEINKMILLK